MSQGQSFKKYIVYIVSEQIQILITLDVNIRKEHCKRDIKASFLQCFGRVHKIAKSDS
jgi:hypothetical protein